MAFYVLQHGWCLQNNSTCWQQAGHFGNILCFDQNYQPGKITLQVSGLIIKYLVAVFLIR